MMLSAQRKTKPVEKNSESYDLPTYFTFWDMDDTSIDTKNDRIKNPQLLLPLLLFQTFAPNQHVGIMTNRSETIDADSESTKYSVKDYVNDLSRFGIHIPLEHLVFGGGALAKPQSQGRYDLENSLDVITRELNALRLTDLGDDLIQKFKALGLAKTDETCDTKISLKPLYSSLEATHYHGKNFLITNFLDSCYSDEAEKFKFATGICKKGELLVGIVDDIDNISDVAKALGKAFFGIKASRGGKPPKGDLSADDDYYQVDYLIKVAEKIGFLAYIESVLTQPDIHEKDPPMLKLSAFLFAWQTKAKELRSKQFLQFRTLLSHEECIQALQMLQYIKTFANKHEQSRYIPVDKLVRLFEQFVSFDQDMLFLNQAFANYCSIMQSIYIEKAKSSIPTSASETDLASLSKEKKKKKSFGSGLFKTRSARSSKHSSDSSSESSPIKTPEMTKLESLKREKRLLSEKVRKFTGSKISEVAELATRIFEEMSHVKPSGWVAYESKSDPTPPLSSPRRSPFLGTRGGHNGRKLERRSNSKHLSADVKESKHAKKVDSSTSDEEESSTSSELSRSPSPKNKRGHKPTSTVLDH